MDVDVGKLRVRQATLADATAISRVEEASFSTDKISPRQLRYLLGKGKTLCLVATLDGEVVGYLLSLVPKHPRPARLYSLAVLRAHRGRGIASRLLRRMIILLGKAGYTRARLEVRKASRDVVALYEEFGFQPRETLPGYYADGADGLRMEMGL